MQLHLARNGCSCTQFHTLYCARPLQENELEDLVIDEWRGVSRESGDVVCDVAGGVCPWKVINRSNRIDWNISTSAAVLMVRVFAHLFLKYVGVQRGVGW